MPYFPMCILGFGSFGGDSGDDEFLNSAEISCEDDAEVRWYCSHDFVCGYVLLK